MKFKKGTIVNTPIPTGKLKDHLGIQVTKEFLVYKLGVQPMFDAKTTAYWDDVQLIRQRLGEYFTKTAKL